jgi:predicted alpha/beta hydrolase family esterase
MVYSKTFHVTRQLLFFHGGGEEGYEADKAMVNSLQESLANGYDINYPELQPDESAPDFGWIKQIEQKVLGTKEDAIIVAHSLGASMLLKYLSEKPVSKKIKGVFLISTPHWSGNEDWIIGLQLRENFAANLPVDVPLFFYHCKDDEVAPFYHLDYYKQNVTKATFREIESGGHQLNNDLTLVARDIKSLG